MVKKLLTEKIENITNDIEALRKELRILSTTSGAKRNINLITSVDGQIKYSQIQLLTYREILQEVNKMELKNETK